MPLGIFRGFKMSVSLKCDFLVDLIIYISVERHCCDMATLGPKGICLLHTMHNFGIYCEIYVIIKIDEKRFNVTLCHKKT